ncbi:MAG: hypothetical protein K6U87_10355 [Firmicutes bacterium]|nr:hypothetical protein [Bacillota bacterium]
MIELLQFLVTGLVNGSIYALIGLGFVLIYRSTKVLNFAQGVFSVLAGISVAVGSRMGFWGGVVGFVVGVALASLAGILVGWAVTWQRLSGGLNPLVATVAISLVIEGALLALVGGAPPSYSPVGGTCRGT